MEEEMESLDMWTAMYAENPGKYPKPYTSNEIIEMRNGRPDGQKDFSN